MNGPLAARAPGKVNLCLRVGAPRADGLHELVSAVQAVSLADDLTLEPASGPGDEVVCPEVEGENLAARALAAYREAAGWDGSPQRLRIVKRLPVAGGMKRGRTARGSHNLHKVLVHSGRANRCRASRYRTISIG